MAIMRNQIDENSTCVCKKSIADKPHEKWIKCEAEGCSSPWWHISCAGLEGIPDSAVKKIAYKCPKCALNAVNVKCVEHTSYTKDISEEIKKSLPEIVRAVVRETTETVSKTYVDAVKEEQEIFLKETVRSTSQNAVQLMHDMEVRERNVVIFNIDESTKSSKDECVRDDEKFINELCLQIEIEEPSILKVNRIGKKDENKKRPVKVCFNNEFDKRKFFAKLYLLKDAEEKYKKVQVQHDLSQDERNVIKKLAKEAEKKNEEEKPVDFLYRVRGSPGAMKVVKVYKKSRK